VGDQWVSYERLDPYAMLFGIVADLNEITDELSDYDREELGAATFVAFIGDFLRGASNAPGEFAARTVAVVARNVTSKLYLQGLVDLLDAVSSGDPAQAGKWIADKAGSFVPNAFRQTNPDPYLREVRGFLDNLRSRVPGFSETLDPR
jgi:hypothetical protein